MKLQQAPEGAYFQTAVFSGDPTGHDGSNSLSTPIPSGTVLALTGGASIIAEAGYAVNQAKDAKGPPMAFKLGGWYHTSNRFQDQRLDTLGISLASPASNGIPREHSDNWGFYGMADASIYQTESGGLSGFVRIAGGPGDRNLISLYVDGGLTYKGLIPGRDDDTAGIAAGYARIGNNARGLDRDTQVFGDPLFPVAIFNPGGHVQNPDGSIRRNALVLGLRSALTF